jgi:hypothetical protein
LRTHYPKRMPCDKGNTTPAWPRPHWPTHITRARSARVQQSVLRCGARAQLYALLSSALKLAIPPFCMFFWDFGPYFLLSPPPHLSPLSSPSPSDRHTHRQTFERRNTHAQQPCALPLPPPTSLSHTRAHATTNTHQCSALGFSPSTIVYQKNSLVLTVGHTWRCLRAQKGSPCAARPSRFFFSGRLEGQQSFDDVSFWYVCLTPHSCNAILQSTSVTRRLRGGVVCIQGNKLRQRRRACSFVQDSTHLAQAPGGFFPFNHSPNVLIPFIYIHFTTHTFNRYKRKHCTSSLR